MVANLPDQPERALLTALSDVLHPMQSGTLTLHIFAH